MRLGILTSSRADFGIYLPLLKKLFADPFFKVEIIAFGTHLSPFQGYTITQIKKENFPVAFQIESLVVGDSKETMGTSMALTTMKFSTFWQEHHKRFDWVFCLGDRFEMMSAVIAAIPFGIRIAHIHGGETSLGALDNIYRHTISLCSSLHFTSTDDYATRVRQLVGKADANVHTTGALSLDNLHSLSLLSIEEFRQQWSIDLSRRTMLITLHPETLSVSANANFATVVARAIKRLSGYQAVITMPNADAESASIRSVWSYEFAADKNVHLVENFGTLGYFSCMKHCAFLLGNTSSGIIEAASFGRYVINLGERQKGRARGANVVDCAFDESMILSTVSQIEKMKPYAEQNIYFKHGAADKIISVLKSTGK